MKKQFAIRLYNLGHYIEFPYTEAKTNFSVRAKKNINLDSGLQVEIKNDLNDSNIDEYKNHPQDITITSNGTL